MKATLVYHRVDTDGVLSAMIMKSKLLEVLQFDEIELIGYNYGDPYPVFSVNSELVCMVDISFPSEMMISLKDMYGSNRIIWIDHHVSAIKDSEEFGYSDLSGLRRIGTGACELCWEWCFPDNTVPLVVQYSSAYDVWDKSRFPWENVLAVSYGFRNRYGVSLKELEQDINNLFSSDSIVYSLMNEGNIILKYLGKKWKSDVKNYSFKVKVGGLYNGICILGTEFSSNVFTSVFQDYDLYIVCNRKDLNTYGISMYKEPDRIPEFSCADYMKQHYDGGGHRSAAGGKLGREQFERLIYNQEL